MAHERHFTLVLQVTIGFGQSGAPAVSMSAAGSPGLQVALQGPEQQHFLGSTGPAAPMGPMGHGAAGPAAAGPAAAGPASRSRRQQEFPNLGGFAAAPRGPPPGTPLPGDTGHAAGEQGSRPYPTRATPRTPPFDPERRTRPLESHGPEEESPRHADEAASSSRRIQVPGPATQAQRDQLQMLLGALSESDDGDDDPEGCPGPEPPAKRRGRPPRRRGA